MTYQRAAQIGREEGLRAAAFENRGYWRFGEKVVEEVDQTGEDDARASLSWSGVLLSGPDGADYGSSPPASAIASTSLQRCARSDLLPTDSVLVRVPESTNACAPNVPRRTPPAEAGSGSGPATKQTVPLSLPLGCQSPHHRGTASTQLVNRHAGVIASRQRTAVPMRRIERR